MALAAAAVKNQRKRHAKQNADHALSYVNEQKSYLNTVAVRHRDSITSVSTVDSARKVLFNEDVEVN